MCFPVDLLGLWCCYGESGRIKPGSVNAVCDPLRPAKGNCRRYADGYTSIVDLAAGPHGTIAVVELAKATWLAAEGPSATPVIGSLFIQYPGRHNRAGYKKELAKGKLVLPAGAAVNRYGDVFVSSPLFGPGALYRIR